MAISLILRAWPSTCWRFHGITIWITWSNSAQSGSCLASLSKMRSGWWTQSKNILWPICPRCSCKFTVKCSHRSFSNNLCSLAQTQGRPVPLLSSRMTMRMMKRECIHRSSHRTSLLDPKRKPSQLKWVRSLQTSILYYPWAKMHQQLKHNLPLK